MLLKRLVSWAEVLLLVVAITAVAISSVSAASVTGGDILGLRGQDVRSVEIHHGDLVTLIEKSGGEWNVLEPVSDRANQAAVEDMLQRLSGLTIADELSGNSPEFGFDPPQSSIRVTTADGQERELLVGNLRSPVSLYVKAAGDDVVYAISNVTFARLGEYPMGFVDGTLLSLASAENVRSIEVRRAAQGEEAATEFVVRRDGEAWVFGTGEVAFDIDGFFRAAKLVEASGRLADDETTSGRFYPAPGTADIAIGYDDGAQQTIRVGVKSADGHHYYVRVTGRDDTYLVPSFHAEHLVTRATSINDSLLSFEYDSVKQLRLKVGADGQEVVFDKNRDGIWESNRSVVFGFQTLMDAIAEVGAERLVSAQQSDNPEYGFGTAADAIQVNMTFTDNNTLGLSIGGETSGGDGVYLKTTMRPGVYEGLAEHAAAIATASQSVRTQLFPAAIDQVAQIRVQRSGEDFVVERNGSGWGKAGQEVTEANVEKLVTALNALSADSLPPVPDDESELGFYPGGQGTRITVTFDDGVERYVDLGAGVQVGSGWFATTSYYASVSDIDDVAFVKEQSVRNITSAVDSLR